MIPKVCRIEKDVACILIGEGLKYFVFNPSIDEKNPPTYTEFSFDSGMSFKNVFFPEKEDLIAKIDFFQKNGIKKEVFHTPLDSFSMESLDVQSKQLQI